MTIIGLVGSAGSGKDTLANYLINQYNFQKYSFASSLKDAIASIFNWDRNLLEGDTEISRKFRETKDDFWKISPREAMQTIGTDLFRNHFDPDIWVKSLILKIKDQKNIVISDCRFENEVKALKNIGAIIIKIERDDNIKKDIHISESLNISENLIDFKIQNKNSKEDFFKNFEHLNIDTHNF